MKKIFFLLLLIAGSVSAQRYETISGDFKNLKGITEYNVTFDYSKIVVNGFNSEAEYLDDKMRKRENVPGKAEQFKEEWYANRENMYKPAFISYFNKGFKDGEVKVGENPSAKYTMDISTTWVYPGYNAGTATEPAKISVIITVKETANPGNVLLAISFDKLLGLKHDLGNTLGDRISWAYEKVAKNFTIQLKRFI
ncbi:hypothetical protein [Flavobacterium sp. 3HN19-14]|uniref:hypothetical protein n=1 Tax=Flavobacterium sp. 3HN19-14 TaxID=3448133 RepID=UPI003EE3A6D3